MAQSQRHAAHAMANASKAKTVPFRTRTTPPFPKMASASLPSSLATIAGKHMAHMPADAKHVQEARLPSSLWPGLFDSSSPARLFPTIRASQRPWRNRTATSTHAKPNNAITAHAAMEPRSIHRSFPTTLSELPSPNIIPHRTCDDRAPKPSSPEATRWHRPSTKKAPGCRTPCAVAFIWKARWNETTPARPRTGRRRTGRRIFRMRRFRRNAPHGCPCREL